MLRASGLSVSHNERDLCKNSGGYTPMRPEPPAISPDRALERRITKVFFNARWQRRFPAYSPAESEVLCTIHPWLAVSRKYVST